MAISSTFSFVPIVGLNTLITIADADDPLSDTLYPYVLARNGVPFDTVPLNTFGDDDPSSVVTGGVGRDGNMIFAGIIEGTFIGGGEGGNTFSFYIGMNMPGVMRGTTDFTDAQTADPEAFPLGDPTLYLPRWTVQPCFSPFRPFGGESGPINNAWPFGQYSMTIGNDNEGLGGYLSPTFWQENSAGVINSGNLGQYGWFKTKVQIDVDPTFEEGQFAFMVTIDFSHTKIN